MPDEDIWDAAELVDTTEEEPAPKPQKKPSASGKGFQVPAHPIFRWGVEDYGPTITGRSAQKLADSGIAPLVALTRGYRVVDPTGDIAKTKRAIGLRGNTRQGTDFTRAAQGDGVMLMPWYPVERVREAVKDKTLNPTTTNWQYRPAVPSVDDDGRERKYEMIGGSETIIGTHPCVPATWIDPDAKSRDKHPILLAEGLLKADSALTAMLIDGGVEPQELGIFGENGEPLSEAELRRNLYDLMNKMPVTNQVFITEIAGVGNWRSNPEWAFFQKGRTWWIGVDGDVSTNPAVWKQMNDLWHLLETSKGSEGKVHLLAPAVGDATGGMKKMGIDDYLAQVGTWADLLTYLAPNLPPAPKMENARAGDWRVNAKGTFCEKAEDRLDSQGNKIGVRWVDVFPMGGRVISTVTRRDASRAELEIGRIATSDDHTADDTCSIELTWEDPATGDERHRTIQGPANILSVPPDMWGRLSGVHVHPDIQRHPAWPPSGPAGKSWLSAIKAHRYAEQNPQVAWRHTGWVPTSTSEGHIPAYILGEHQVYADPEDEGSVLLDPNVKVQLTNYDKFGIGSEGPDASMPSLDDPEYREEIRMAIEATLDHYVFARPWQDPGVAALTIAFGLRPVLPTRSKTTVYFVGPPAAGKTFTAAKSMAFWSKRPGDWNNNSLPGTANTTYTATEFALATAPIWVADDLAPSVSANKANSEEGTMESLIRAVFNGQGKPRGARDGGMQRILNPRCPFMVTAENLPTVQSIRSRAIIVTIEKGALNESRVPTNELDDFCDNDQGDPARITEALVLYVRERARASGWPELIESLKTQLKDQQSSAVGYLRNTMGVPEGSTKRPSELASDMTLALAWLNSLAEEVGVSGKYMELFGDEDTDEIPSLGKRLIALCAKSYSQVAETSPGYALLLALRNALAAKHCHIVDAAAPDIAPAVNDFIGVANDLGWGKTGDSDSPKGPTIGKLFYSPDNVPTVLFNRDNAFAIARAKYPELIPFGQKASASWRALVGEGLSSPTFKPQGTSVTSRITALPGKPSGIPIPLDILLRAEK